MPSRFVLRSYVKNGIYHVFNRGVEKRDIFMSDVDYKIFIYYLNVYLTPENELAKQYPDLPFRLQNKNLAE